MEQLLLSINGNCQQSKWNYSSAGTKGGREEREKKSPGEAWCHPPPPTPSHAGRVQGVLRATLHFPEGRRRLPGASCFSSSNLWESKSGPREPSVPSLSSLDLAALQRNTSEAHTPLRKAHNRTTTQTTPLGSSTTWLPEAPFHSPREPLKS